MCAYARVCVCACTHTHTHTHLNICYFRQNMYFPAMSTKITIHQNSEKPRYIQSNCGIPPSSPSKVSNIYLMRLHILVLKERNLF